MISSAKEFVHEKNKKPVQITHTAIPLIQANELPKLGKSDGGFYRRFVIINFLKELKLVKI